jgi:hypothetical protein
MKIVTLLGQMSYCGGVGWGGGASYDDLGRLSMRALPARSVRLTTTNLIERQTA